MTTPPPIRLDGVSKCYRIYRNPQDRFKQALLDRFHLAARRTGPRAALYREHWALRDVSFELQPGEAVGILGRNGAGKSTLLQLIAGTLEPTSGSVRTHGRITALLELGSGFNPEFTGRENVYLNAQILGLSRQDAEARFDGIAAFADIGDFIDQPVKTYSSGMMMRLAFAVQTAVDPKILIVDEALSVGDMFFQAKCMARIRKLVDDGVTLLFVSHDVGAVRQLCGRAVLLAEGAVTAIGPTRTVADEYVKRQLEDRNRASQARLGPVPPDAARGMPPPVAPEATPPRPVPVAGDGRGGGDPDPDPDLMFGAETFRLRADGARTGNRRATVLNVQMLRDGQHGVEFDFDDLVEIRVLVRFGSDTGNLNVAVKVRTLQGTDVIFLDTRLQGRFGQTYRANGTYLFAWQVRLPLMHGNYAVSVGLASPPARPGEDWTFIDMIQHAYDFKMAPRGAGMIGGFVALPATLQVDLVHHAATGTSPC